MTSNRYLKGYVTIRIMQPAAVLIFRGKKKNQTSTVLKEIRMCSILPTFPNGDPAGADVQARLPCSLKPHVVCLQSDANLVSSGDRSVYSKDLAVVLKPHTGCNSYLKSAF